MMLIGGSFFYTQTVLAKELATQAMKDKKLRQDAIQAQQLVVQFEAQRALQAAKESQLKKDEQFRIGQIQDQAIKAQAQYEAQQAAIVRQRAATALLAQQQAAQLAAQQFQQQMQPQIRLSRQSRAS